MTPPEPTSRPTSAPTPATTPSPTPAPAPWRGHPSGPWEEYPTHPGFTLKLVEDFDTPINLDDDPIWTWSDGAPSFGKVRFVKENINFRDGKMSISVTKEEPSEAQTCSAAEAGAVEDFKLSAGEMRTKHNMFRYGRYEVRMKAPAVQGDNTWIEGNFVASMFIFRDGKFKHWREIDFQLTGDDRAMHWPKVLYAENTSEWSEDIEERLPFRVANADTRKHFHTYAIEWLPDSIAWYVDDVEFKVYKGWSVPIPDLPGKFMMNLWIYNDTEDFGGKEGQNNRYPMTAEYEWFRFYQWNGESTYPCAGLGTSCLTADDMYLTKNNPCDGIEQQGMINGAAPCKTTCPQ